MAAHSFASVFLILCWNMSVLAEKEFRLGVIDSVDSDTFQQIYDTLEETKEVNVTMYNVTNFIDYNYVNILEAHDRLSNKSIDALIGDYNSVYAAVSTELKINYYVTSITPSDQKPSMYMYQLFPDAKVFAKAALDLVKYYSFMNIAIILDSFEGTVIMDKILRKSNEEMQALKVSEATSADAESDLRLELKLMRDSYFNSYIVVCSRNNTDRVLRQALSLSMLSLPHKWLLVNTGPDEFDLTEYQDTKANLTVLRMMMNTDPERCNISHLNLKKAVFHDALQYCYNFWNRSQEEDLPLKRNISKRVRGEVNELNIKDCTGYLRFKSKGKRFKQYLQLMSLDGLKTNQTGTWSSQGNTIVNRVNPSKSYSRVVGKEENVFGGTILRITTKIEPPFVQRNNDGILEGHLIDILEKLKERLNFECNVTLVPDGKFGSKKPPPRGWTGMVRQLLDGKADVALAPFQMTPSRSQVVDFTTSFMTKGTVAVIEKPKTTGLRVFMSPLSDTVWMAIFASFLVVSLVLFSVSRLNSDRQQKYTHNLRESFWYIWGTLLRGSLTGSPHAISSRIVASAWWFFCLIVISLYTANLAAFLTINNNNVGISTAADLAYQDYFEYGTVDGTQIEYFFEHTKMDHYQKMWAHMKTLNPQSMVRRVEDGFERVKEGGYAFIWDSPTISHVISRNCSLMQIGHPFDLKGYGIAYQKNADFGEALSLGILRLKEMGVINMLEEKWWRRGFCPDARASAKTKSLDVENVAGMFLVLTGGVGISGILCFIKFCFSRPNKKKTRTSTYHDDVDKADNSRTEACEHSRDVVHGHSPNVQFFANQWRLKRRSHVI